MENRQAVETFIGPRIRQLREGKGLTQRAVAERSGLLPTSISRMENGHRVPSLEALERVAATLEVPLYQLFHSDGDRALSLYPTRSLAETPSTGCGEQTPRKSEEPADVQFLRELVDLWSEISARDRRIFLALVQKLSDPDGTAPKRQISRRPSCVGKKFSESPSPD
jgi:transcriptional regulator with XRE-family HTH domain